MKESPTAGYGRVPAIVLDPAMARDNDVRRQGDGVGRLEELDRRAERQLPAQHGQIVIGVDPFHLSRGRRAGSRAQAVYLNEGSNLTCAALLDNVPGRHQNMRLNLKAGPNGIAMTGQDSADVPGDLIIELPHRWPPG